MLTATHLLNLVTEICYLMSVGRHKTGVGDRSQLGERPFPPVQPFLLFPPKTVFRHYLVMSIFWIGADGKMSTAGVIPVSVLQPMRHTMDPTWLQLYKFDMRIKTGFFTLFLSVEIFLVFETKRDYLGGGTGHAREDYPWGKFEIEIQKNPSPFRT